MGALVGLPRLRFFEIFPAERGLGIAVCLQKRKPFKGFVKACREIGVTPHVAQNTNGRRSAIDGRTTRHAGYA